MKVDIQPVQVFPGTATRLFISDQFQTTLNSTPEFNCALYAVYGVGAVKETEESLKSGITAKMTQAQWSAWSSQSDEDYIKACVLENLGLKAA